MTETTSALVPEAVRALVNRYVELVDGVLPGRIDGLYLVGSLALGDYTPGQSDVDFVAVTRDLLTARERNRLRGVHAALLDAAPHPWFDGIYVTWEHVRKNPLAVEDVPFTHEGTFEPTGAFEANPSTWLTLSKYPLAIRGPEAPDVWHDADIIRRWNIDNLNSYWRGLMNGRRGALNRAVGLAGDRMMNEAIRWCVPGVARLHYTIMTGDITSKSGACHYALGTFPDRWHTVINEALSLRHGESPPRRSRLSRHRDLLGFMEVVIDDAGDHAPDGQ